MKCTIDFNPETVVRVASGDEKDAFLTWRFGYPTGREAYRIPQYSENIRFRKTYMVGVRIVHGEVGGTLYRIYDSWSTELNAVVDIDPSKSGYR